MTRGCGEWLSLTQLKFCCCLISDASVLYILAQGHFSTIFPLFRAVFFFSYFFLAKCVYRPAVSQETSISGMQGNFTVSVKSMVSEQTIGLYRRLAAYALLGVGEEICHPRTGSKRPMICIGLHVPYCSARHRLHTASILELGKVTFLEHRSQNLPATGHAG